MFDSARNGRCEAHQAIVQEQFGYHWTHYRQLRHVDPSKFLATLRAIRRVTYLVIIALIPSGTVHQLALEVMKAGNTGPLPGVQCTRCLDQNIAPICICGRAIDILDLEIKSVIRLASRDGPITCRFHFECSSSQTASEICCFNLIYFMHPYFSATRFQYWWISRALA